MINFLKNVSGFTLLEMLSAVIILGLITGPILGLFGQGVNSIRDTSDYTKAVLFAKGEMEYLRSLSYLELEDHQNIELQNIPPYTASLQVENWKDTNMLKVMLTVIWESRGREHDFTLTTLKSRR